MTTPAKITTHGKQFIIEIGDNNEGILANHSFVVTIGNEGAGPYLIVGANNLDPNYECDSRSVPLQTPEEIDELCAQLKAILLAADAVDKAVPNG